MVKASWILASNVGDGCEESPNRPGLPVGVGGRTQVYGDLTRLTGPAAQPHRHLLIGGIALQDDNLDGAPVGDGHVHYVVKVGENYTQLTVDAPAHTHDLSLSANGNLIPDYFLFFWVGSDADAVTIINSATCFPLVQCEVTANDEGGYNIGAMLNDWASHDTAWWQTKMLDVLGVQLPEEIDRGKRLVLLLLGALMARQVSEDNEPGYRYRSV